MSFPRASSFDSSALDLDYGTKAEIQAEVAAQAQRDFAALKGPLKGWPVGSGYAAVAGDWNRKTVPSHLFSMRSEAQQFANKNGLYVVGRPGTWGMAGY